MADTVQQQGVYSAPADFIAKAHVDAAAYERMYAASVADPEAFWREHGKRIDWIQDYTKVKDTTFDYGKVSIKWFEDGTLNVSANCIDRHMARRANQTAIIWEPDDPKTPAQHITYAQLLEQTCRMANVLKKHGVKKGDRVVLYLPMIPEAAYAMLACARIGAIHSVVFGGFSPDALANRINDSEAKVVITADFAPRGGKKTPLKGNADQALLHCSDKVKCLVVKHTGDQTHWSAGRDFDLKAEMAEAKPYCPYVEVGAEDPLFILYTSGSTGKPKGVVHTSGGYLVYASLTHQMTFDYHDGDVFWCTADIGWVTGHTYITYGPLALGGTEIVFEGVPTYPDAGRFWKMIQDHKVSIFYTAPTAIRSLIKAAEANDAVHPKSYNLSSLRLLGSVGEPINPAAWEWYYQHVGGSRCPIVDTFWQTETGGHMITPLPGVTPMVPGSCTLPFPGIQAAIVSETGEDMPNGQGGILVVKRPWPSMIRNIWGDPERFKKSYYPEDFKGKYYLAGDGAIRDAETGYFTITGRIDDVLNVSGHRMGTMEIESALVSCTELVAEAAVVGRPDDTTGEAICAFVVLKRALPNTDEGKAIAKQLRDHIAKEIGPIAKPKDIRFGENLPKTRSGKIMRRLLRSLAKGEAITQDTSTLENPHILDQLGQAY